MFIWGKKSNFHNYISNVILTVKINKTQKQVGHAPSHRQCVSVFLVDVILGNEMFVLYFSPTLFKFAMLTSNYFYETLPPTSSFY